MTDEDIPRQRIQLARLAGLSPREMRKEEHHRWTQQEKREMHQPCFPGARIQEDLRQQGHNKNTNRLCSRINTSTLRDTGSSYTKHGGAPCARVPEANKAGSGT